VGPPEYIVIEPVEPDYIYVPVYDPVVVYGPGYWSPAYVPFFWYPPWWTVGPAFGFGAALFVGPALWYHYNWGYGGFAAIQTNTVLYSQFNKVNISGGGQFQNWKFDPAHHGGVQFKNAKLQQHFGTPGGKNFQGIQTGKTIQSLQGVQNNKSIQGVQTAKGISGNQNAKRVEKIQSGKSVKTGQNVSNIKSTKVVSSQAIHPVYSGNKGRANLGNANKNKNLGHHR
jgi:hypothetical protein